MGAVIVTLALLPFVLIKITYRRRDVRLISKPTLLGPAWLELAAPRLPKRLRDKQWVELVFREPFRVGRELGPVEPSGKAILPDLELRSQDGRWHPVTRHGTVSGEPSPLCYWIYDDEFDSRGPFVAVRLRASEPLTLLQVRWRDHYDYDFSYRG
jgi:hypothetical protein